MVLPPGHHQALVRWNDEKLSLPPGIHSVEGGSTPPSEREQQAEDKWELLLGYDPNYSDDSDDSTSSE